MIIPYSHCNVNEQFISFLIIFYGSLVEIFRLKLFFWVLKKRSHSVWKSCSVCADPVRQRAWMQHYSGLRGGPADVRRRLLHLRARIGPNFTTLCIDESAKMRNVNERKTAVHRKWCNCCSASFWPPKAVFPNYSTLTLVLPVYHTVCSGITCR